MQKSFSLLVKPASADCNLRCQYCFYLDHSSLYPEVKRHRMPDGVLERMIQSYMATDQPQYTFGWQGGEPTLMGVDFFRRVVELQKKYGRSGAVVSNGLQTNATLIDDEFAAHLGKYKFLVGTSLDGPQKLHDRFRLTVDGRGSHADVLKGIECLKRNKVEFNILTLVSKGNVGHVPEVYRYLCDMGFYYHQYIPCVEFDSKGQPLPYTITGEEWGEFLCRLFDEWYKNDTRRVSIRHFDSILVLMVDGGYTVCHLGGNCCQYFVVEYNGDVYPCDFFVQPATRLGNVMENSWQELQSSPKYHEFGRQKNLWNDQCSRCPYLLYCSGDCLKHRIYSGNPPEHLSWLCAGWKMFYQHTLPRFKELATSIVKDRQRYGWKSPWRNTGLFVDERFERNEPCFCGSGRKYKKCHGGPAA